MATKKVTVTVDEAQLARIRELVAAGNASSVSGFVQHAVGVTLDRDERSVVVLAARAAQTGVRLTVPATVLVRVDATGVGRLLASSGTADVVDAQVVICARRAGQRVVTSDPDDLRRLDPRIELIVV